MGNGESSMQQEREAEEKRRAEAEVKRRIEAEVKRRIEAEEKRRIEAEEKRQAAAEEKRRIEAEEKRRIEAEEKRRIEAEEKRRIEAEEKRRIEVEKKRRIVAEEKRRIEAEEKRRAGAEEKRREEAEEEPWIETLYDRLKSNSAFRRQSDGEEKRQHESTELLRKQTEMCMEVFGLFVNSYLEEPVASSRFELELENTRLRHKRRSRLYDLDSLRDNDMCPICFETLRKPKFLTCHHTFCAHCLYQLSKKGQNNTVICPCCREITRLPTEGISGLPTNNYVISCLPDECCDCIDQVHSFYCTECDKAVCKDCLHPEHCTHKIEHLHVALERKRYTLKKKVSDIYEMEDGLKSRLQTASQESRDVTKKTAVLEARILDQSALMLAAVHDARNKALKTLKTVSEDIQNGLSEKQKSTESHLENIVRHRIQIERASAGNDPGTIISAARSCEFDDTINDVQTDLEQYKPVTHPVLVGTSDLETFEKDACSAFGEVSTIQMTCGDKHDVEINKTFSCTQQARIFSLCHVDDDSPFIEVSCSHARQELRKRFGEDGTLLESVLHKTCHFKRYAPGKRMAPDLSQTSNIISTFSKSHSVHYRLNRLNNKSPGKAVILSVVVNPNPFSIEGKKEFEINLTCVHRSFDVDDTETHFVVVEEAQDPRGQRQVHLFQRPGGDPVATYKSPVQAFQPSDVCFYRLTLQVLLVADEANDVIHVVMIEAKRMIFLRYLNIAPGAPLLISPTAINTDIDGRLWVGTKTGQIMAFKPVGIEEGATAAFSP